jgi:hypothetical protein
MTQSELVPTLQRLAELTKSFLPASDRLSPSEVFEEWLLQSITQYLFTPNSSVFAPFNPYFSSPREFRESFSAFVKGEIGGNNLSAIQARLIVSRVLQNRLQFAIERSKGNVLGHTIFDLFGFLLDIDSEEAFSWAARAVQPQSEFSLMSTPGGRPAPIALYSIFVGADTTGPAKAQFLQSLLNWCIHNVELPEVPPAARRLLPVALRAIDEPGRAERQICLIDRMLSTLANGTTLIDRIGELVDSEQELLGDSSSGKTLAEIESENLRKAMDATAPLLVRQMNEDRKDSWRLSYLTNSAFQKELLSETKSVEFHRDYKSSMLDILGVSKSTLIQFAHSLHLRRAAMETNNGT